MCSKPQITMLFLSIVLGILLGTSILLATKINNPTINSTGTSLDYLLGKFVPEYELEKLDGGLVSTHLYKGESYLLVFTMPDCKACDTMYPILEKASADIPVLMISTTQEGLMEKISEYALAFPIAVDSLLLTMEHLNITDFPSALLVDREQSIVEAVRGGGFPIEDIVQSAQKTLEQERTE